MSFENVWDVYLKTTFPPKKTSKKIIKGCFAG